MLSQLPNSDCILKPKDILEPKVTFLPTTIMTQSKKLYFMLSPNQGNLENVHHFSGDCSSARENQKARKLPMETDLFSPLSTMQCSIIRCSCTLTTMQLLSAHTTMQLLEKLTESNIIWLAWVIISDCPGQYAWIGSNLECTNMYWHRPQLSLSCDILINKLHSI